MYKEIVSFIQDLYHTKEFIPLHEPRFTGHEKEYLEKCIDSTFVSSVGEFVDLFEQKMADFTGSKYAVATVNGTAALHIALLMAGVKESDEVITQAVSFIATANAISYIGAKPIFIDVEKETMGLSSEKLEEFLFQKTILKNDGFCYNKETRQRISACVPMHTFGHPADIEKISEICKKYNIKLVEDSAESLGSYYKGRHTGQFGEVAAFSFNGNKIITCGGGGMLVTNDEQLAKKAKHITTTAKIPHRWEYKHDQIAYNYRLPNLNAALACAQMENLPQFIARKRGLAQLYINFFKELNLSFFQEKKNSKSNYWLNALILHNRQERDIFLEYMNENGIMCRPIWTLINKLEMYKDCQVENLENSEWLEDRVVNIPSSVII